VTLGTLYIYQALKLWYSGSESIRNTDTEAAAPLLIWFGNVISVGGFQILYGTIAFLLLAWLMSYVLKHTAWGRHVYAVGDDLNGAMLSGVQTDKVLRSVYAVAGVIAAFAGLVLIGRVGGTITPLAGETANLDSITAVVIGGTSLFGGRGTIIGSVLGAIIVGVFRFLQRAWRLAVDERTGALLCAAEADPKVEKLLHRTIAKVGEDLERLSFNTAIAAMIELVNAATRPSDMTDPAKGGMTRDQLLRFASILGPFAPHLADELGREPAAGTPRVDGGEGSEGRGARRSPRQRGACTAPHPRSPPP
jgi:ABC-type branched-subunit amino acid transport system permease subunit